MTGQNIRTTISAASVVGWNPTSLLEKITWASNRALVLMARQGIHHLPLVSEGRLVGVVSEKDIFALRRLSVEGITSAIARPMNPHE